jgi:hypothetical protein
MEAPVTADQARSGIARSSRTLAVVDWSVDPATVAETLRAHTEREPAAFALLVPSRLPGLDWIGDPKASCPCAERQLSEVGALMRRRGLEIEQGRVSEPERVAAIRDAADAWTPDRIVLFDRPRLLGGHPLSVARRVERATRRAVERFEVQPANGQVRGLAHRAPRCATA